MLKKQLQQYWLTRDLSWRRPKEDVLTVNLCRPPTAWWVKALRLRISDVVFLTAAFDGTLINRRLLHCNRHDASRWVESLSLSAIQPRWGQNDVTHTVHFTLNSVRRRSLDRKEETLYICHHFVHRWLFWECESSRWPPFLVHTHHNRAEQHVFVVVFCKDSGGSSYNDGLSSCFTSHASKRCSLVASFGIITHKLLTNPHLEQMHP